MIDVAPYTQVLAICSDLNNIKGPSLVSECGAHSSTPIKSATTFTRKS